MASTAWTPIGVKPPHGVSSRLARHASALSSSAFGNVIVASTCKMTPSSPLSIMLRSFVISGCQWRL